MTPNRRGRTEGSQRVATAGCVAYAVECRKSALPIGTAGQGVSGNDELASAVPAGHAARPARHGPGFPPGQVPGARLPGQAAAAGAAAADRAAGARADLQAHRPGGVLLRPDLLDRLRHRGDAAGRGAGGLGGGRPGAAAGGRDRAPAADPGGVVSPGDPRLPARRRRLHGQPRQPRPAVRLDLRGGAADRLRAHRAVSVSAGTAALASAVEPIGNWRVELSVAFIVLLMWGNLRGIREAGKIFAVPTYLYILSLGGVVLYGIWRVAFGHVGPISYDPASSVGLVGPEGGVVTAVSLFLILHAFSAGTTALTGVEAIADGVPAFRKPEARNAQRTLLVMALIMAFLFLG